MALPGKPKGLAAIIAGPAPEEEDESGDRMEMAAEELISAVKSGDAAGVASAFRAMFETAESEPHDEGGNE